MTEELEDAPAALRPRQGRIRAVLFDFGGVLTTSPFEAFARYEREHGLPPGFIRSLNAQNHHDNAWARLERNEVSIPQFVELFEAESAGAGHVVDGASVLALLGGELRPRMVRAVERCRRHYLVGLLTNNFLSGEAESHPGGGTASVLSLFHQVVESSKVGVRKPEARFFEIACGRQGHDHDQGRERGPGALGAREGGRPQAPLTGAPTERSRRSASSSWWIVAEPVAGLPLVGRLTWRSWARSRRMRWRRPWT